LLSSEGNSRKFSRFFTCALSNAEKTHVRSKGHFLQNSATLVKGYERRGGLPIKHPVIEKDAYIVEKLLEQGAIMVGVANMHQIGIGISGLNSSPWHKTGSRNPIDLRHYTGGSSSGTGAAVSSGLVPFGIGNDGGGSIRIPSAFCGISGIKCTFGRMSLHGDSSSEAGSTVTHQGPMATCMDDLTFLYGIMAGFCDQAFFSFFFRRRN